MSLVGKKSLTTRYQKTRTFGDTHNFQIRDHVVSPDEDACAASCCCHCSYTSLKTHKSLEGFCIVLSGTRRQFLSLHTDLSGGHCSLRSWTEGSYLLSCLVNTLCGILLFMTPRTKGKRLIIFMACRIWTNNQALMHHFTATFRDIYAT